MTEITTTDQSGLEKIKNYIRDFKVLGQNSKSFWVLQGINILDCIAYYAMVTTVTLFLTGQISDGGVGLSDIASGDVMFWWGIIISASLFMTGFITDTIGIKRSIVIGSTIQWVTRGGIAFCALSPELPNREIIIITFFLLSAPGMAMMQTSFQVGNKLFSTNKSRAASFNAWYLLMNLGFVIGALLADQIRVDMMLPISYIFAASAIACVTSVVISLMAINQKTDTLTNLSDEQATQSDELPKSVFKRFTNLIVQPAFQRLLALMAVLTGVRAVFLYGFLLMPLYWKRVMEIPNGGPVEQGFLQMINPLFIFVGLTLFIPIANKFNMFKMLIAGAIVSSLSVLVLALPWEWFGGNMVDGYFNMAIVMMLLLSLGEITWSPKLYEYTAAIAPKGQEGAYMGMSILPYFVAKVVVTKLSGVMLVTWVAEDVSVRIADGTLPFWESPEAMWLVLGVWALSGPVIAWFFRGWFTKGTTAAQQQADSAQPATA
ncbi:hypothetical protein QP938_08020 [Porticoccaceae bacterium LTM1]|nr:hypothetical protein QP938_08020 [Porticoccaceae bacterium LTM1]